jgi:hypothetical protein
MKRDSQAKTAQKVIETDFNDLLLERFAHEPPIHLLMRRYLDKLRLICGLQIMIEMLPVRVLAGILGCLPHIPT